MVNSSRTHYSTPGNSYTCTEAAAAASPPWRTSLNKSCRIQIITTVSLEYTHPSSIAPDQFLTSFFFPTDNNVETNQYNKPSNDNGRTTDGLQSCTIRQQFHPHYMLSDKNMGLQLNSCSWGRQELPRGKLESLLSSSASVERKLQSCELD